MSHLLPSYLGAKVVISQGLGPDCGQGYPSEQVASKQVAPASRRCQNSWGRLFHISPSQEIQLLMSLCGVGLRARRKPAGMGRGAGEKGGVREALYDVTVSRKNGAQSIGDHFFDWLI
jgi:hypothetical protein